MHTFFWRKYVPNIENPKKRIVSGNPIYKLVLEVEQPYL